MVACAFRHDGDERRGPFAQSTSTVHSGEAPVTSSELPYRFEQLEGYAVITLLPQLNDSQWADIEKVGTELVERLKTLDPPKFIVDLSLLNYMGSAMVALIVRLWKSVKDSKKGRMVVVNQHDMVFEVLKLAGLHKVWTIVPSRGEALTALGFSSRASAAAPSSAGAAGGGVLWTVLGLVSVVVAGIGLVLLLSKPEIVGQRGSLLIVVGAAALGLIVGMISAVKETDWRQKIGIVVVAASVILVLVGILMEPGGEAGAAPVGVQTPAADGQQPATEQAKNDG
jgi:anti-anti-sigma factor